MMAREGRRSFRLHTAETKFPLRCQITLGWNQDAYMQDCDDAIKVQL